jgi:hypothetical protein
MMEYECGCKRDDCPACCPIHGAPMTLDQITDADLEWARSVLTQKYGSAVFIKLTPPEREEG